MHALQRQLQAPRQGNLEEGTKIVSNEPTTAGPVTTKLACIPMMSGR
jgi:hypothetical protein